MTAQSLLRSRRCGPALVALVTGPGTAPTIRPNSWARSATFIDPERAPALTTTVAVESAAINRARAMKRWRVGTAPGVSVSEVDCTSVRTRLHSDEGTVQVDLFTPGWCCDLGLGRRSGHRLLGPGRSDVSRDVPGCQYGHRAGSRSPAVASSGLW